MSVFSSSDLFYDLDARRRRSREFDFGATWWLHGDPFRLSWLTDTDELIAVRREAPAHQRGPRTIGVTSHASGIRLLMDGEVWAVYVLATLDAEEVEATLDGWREIVGLPESLAWAVARVTGMEVQRVGRRRRLIPVRAVPR